MLTVIATISQNDPDRTDRVTLYQSSDSDYVYAAAPDEEPHETDCPCAYHWINQVWGSPCWNLQYDTVNDIV